MTRKIVSIVGARPQFVKAAVVSRALIDAIDRGGPEYEEVIVHTGQHYDTDLSDVFFSEMRIPEPKYNLGVVALQHGEMVGRMLVGIEQVLLRERPVAVLVYGDTNSTLAGALAAAKLGIPLAHVEAGLRSFNRRMPEELNRVLTDHASDMLFAPTQAAVRNLKREGVPETRVYLVGDVMYDAALLFGKVAETQSEIMHRLDIAASEYVLGTVHRAENTDDRLRLSNIFSALADVARRVPVVVPLHPRTREALRPFFDFDASATHLRIIEPVGFLDMLMLEKHAAAIVTDSGGVQKEACFYGVPCITLREETEWVETVEIGANILVPPTDPERISTTLVTSLKTRRPWIDIGKFYGDGQAAQRIVRIIASELGLAQNPAMRDQHVRRD